VTANLTKGSLFLWSFILGIHTRPLPQGWLLVIKPRVIVVVSKDSAPSRRLKLVLFRIALT